jgi:hypothetical protein
MTSYVLPHIDDYRAVSRRGSGGNLGGIRYQIEDGVNGFPCVVEAVPKLLRYLELERNLCFLCYLLFRIFAFLL